MSRRQIATTVTVDVDVDVYLDEIDLKDLQEELARRTGDGTATASPKDMLCPVQMVVERHELECIRQMVYMGQYERASREICDLIRDALGTAI